MKNWAFVCRQTNADWNTHRVWTSHHQMRVLFCSTGQRLSSQLDLRVVNNSRPRLFHVNNATPVPKGCESMWDQIGPNLIALRCAPSNSWRQHSVGSQTLGKDFSDVVWSETLWPSEISETLFGRPKKVLCTSRVLNFCCTLHAKNSLDQL